MKFLLGLIALSLIVTSPAHAVGCRGAQVIAGSSAAGAMVAGYRGYRAFSRARDIEKVSATTFFSGRGSPEASANQVQADDKVTIEYNLSREANRRHHIGVLESNIDSEHASASSYRSMAINAAMPKTETYTDSNGHLQTRTVPGDFGQQMMYNNMAESAEREARQLERQLAEVRAGRGTVPVYRLEKVLERTGQVGVAAQITEFSREGSRILKMTRLPRAAVLRIARAARNGWILVATAVGLGLIAGEQVLSDRISCLREQELGRY